MSKKSMKKPTNAVDPATNPAATRLSSMLTPEFPVADVQAVKVEVKYYELANRLVEQAAQIDVLTVQVAEMTAGLVGATKALIEIAGTWALLNPDTRRLLTTAAPSLAQAIANQRPIVESVPSEGPTIESVKKGPFGRPLKAT